MIRRNGTFVTEKVWVSCNEHVRNYSSNSKEQRWPEMVYAKLRALSGNFVITMRGDLTPATEAQPVEPRTRGSEGTDDRGGGHVEKS